MNAGHCRQQGFTMIELITVMILVGILAAYAVPRLGEITGFSGPGYATDVRGALAHARRTAVASRRHVCVTVSSDRISLIMDPSNPDTGTHPSCNAANIVSLPGGDQTGELRVPNNITVASIPPAFSFTPKGESSDNATITTGGESINVRAITGAIE
jgi:MSHA pilin protein MshC